MKQSDSTNECQRHARFHSDCPDCVKEREWEQLKPDTSKQVEPKFIPPYYDRMLSGAIQLQRLSVGERRWATYDCQNPLHGNCITDGVNHEENLTAQSPSTHKEVKVSNDELTELLVWAYKQGFLDATQVQTEAVKSLDDANIRAQLLAGLEALSKPAAPDKPETDGRE
jgi:hypothetical protein